MMLANRGMAYGWKNDLVSAARDFAAVEKVDPSNIVLLHGKAMLAMGRGDMAGGVQWLSKAIARDPNNAWAYSMRAEAYRHLGEREKMQADAIRATRLRR